MKECVQLHCHSQFSLLDGANKIPDMVRVAERDGQRAMALTDHGTMSGTIQFYNACMTAGIKPIIGCEVYIARNSRFRDHSKSNPYNHLTLLAKDYEGYQNLLRLTSLSYIEGLSYKPRIDMELLEKHSRGLICLSGCLSGKINEALLQDDLSAARERTEKMLEIFGEESFWFEIQRNGLNIQARVTESMVKMSKDMNIPLVATNDIHYLRKEDCSFQDTLLCINTGAKKDDLDRFRFETSGLYVKSSNEMLHMFRDLPESIESTLDIAEQIDLTIEQGKFRFPKVSQDGLSDDDVLASKAFNAVKKMYPDSLVTQAMDRASKELGIIKEMGFSGYFLVVEDFVAHSKQRGIPVGPGRGSAAGCIISYLLGITSVDPIKHKLLFERFLNPARKGTIPDIDIDFCQQGRKSVIDYLKDKYGDAQVAGIATYSKFGPKSAIKDLCRVYGVPIEESVQLTSRVVADTLEEALASDPQLKQDEKRHPKVFADAKQLEGMVRHAGVHASGIIVSDVPLYTVVPLAKQISGSGSSKESNLVTQWDLVDCEKVGLVKFDLLGLETLTIINLTERLIMQSKGITVSFSDMKIDDPNLYSVLSLGDTECIFQCFSAGMRGLLKKMQPTTFDDVAAALALYRPGPLESGIVDSFIKRKHGQEPVEYIHPDVEEFLSGTYGTMVYQEQIMQLSVALAGFSMSDADDLRKAIGKKKADDLDKLEKRFVDGCKRLGKITEDQVSKLWHDIVKFGRYGFNASHSVSYAYITLYTVHLKHYYPEEFFAANLTQEVGDHEKLKAVFNDALAHGIQLVPPNLLDRSWDFSVPSPGSISIGLCAIKGLGSSFRDELESISLPNSRDIITFVSKTPKGMLKKVVLEVLDKAGAFHSFKLPKGAICENASLIVKDADNIRSLDSSMTLFGDVDTTSVKRLDSSWDAHKILSSEREAYGFYLSGHPILYSLYDSYRKVGLLPSDVRVREDIKRRKIITVAGIITGVEIKKVKSGVNKGKKYLHFTLEDQCNYITVTVFSNVYAKYSSLIARAELDVTPVVVDCYSVNKEDSQNFVCKSIYELSSVQDCLSEMSMYLYDISNLDRIKSALKTSADLSKSLAEKLTLRYITDNNIEMAFFVETPLSNELLNSIMKLSR